MRQPEYDEDFCSPRKLKFVFSAYEWMGSIVSSVIVIFAVFAFVVRPVGVEGSSMVPTLNDGDWLAITGFDYEPKAGEIVIITQPNRVNNEPIVKRIIAVGGQEVDIDFVSGDVKVDGVLLNEPYIKEQTHRMYDVVFPVVVPEGYLFVMGDNRNGSIDSRSTAIGMINEKYVLGRAIARVLPLGSASLKYKGVVGYE